MTKFEEEFDNCLHFGFIPNEQQNKIIEHFKVFMVGQRVRRIRGIQVINKNENGKITNFLIQVLTAIILIGICVIIIGLILRIVRFIWFGY